LVALDADAHLPADVIADGSLPAAKLAQGACEVGEVLKWNGETGWACAEDVGFDPTTLDGWDTDASDDLTTATTFAGEVTGTADALTIADGAVTAAKLSESYLPAAGGTASGVLGAQGGLKLATTGALPSCEAASRGLMYLVPGDAGVSDAGYVCIKKSDDTYAWRKLFSSAKTDVESSTCNNVSNFCGGGGNCQRTITCPAGTGLTSVELNYCQGSGCNSLSSKATPSSKPAWVTFGAGCSTSGLSGACTATWTWGSGCCCDSDDYNKGQLKGVCE